MAVRAFDIHRRSHCFKVVLVTAGHAANLIELRYLCADRKRCADVPLLRARTERDRSPVRSRALMGLDCERADSTSSAGKCGGPWQNPDPQ